MIYVNLDGKWHVQTEDPASLAASTECGIAIPFATEWSHDEPTADRCAKCLPKKKAA